MGPALSGIDPDQVRLIATNRPFDWPKASAPFARCFEVSTEILSHSLDRDAILDGLAGSIAQAHLDILLVAAPTSIIGVGQP